MNTPRRQLRLIAAGSTLALTLVLLAQPAYADNGTGAALGPFDLTDSHGIKISQYQLSIDQGGALSPLQMMYYSALTITWDAYRFWVGFIAYVVNWATSLSWVNWVTGPMHAAELALHDQVLQPLNLTSISGTGLMGILLVLAGCAASIHLVRGRPGRGITEALSSAAAAALAVGLLASPVALFAGDGTELAMPLQVAQRTGVELSNIVTNDKASNAPVSSHISVADGNGVGGAGQIITDTFMRPVHQMFNYGTVIDAHSEGCVGAYDKALKAGPYDGGADKVRAAVGGCSKKLQTYADSSSWTRLIGLGIYGFTALVLGALILVFVVLLMMAVLTLTWASLKLLIHAPMAILPGDSRGPGLKDLVDVITSLVFLVAHLVLLSVLIRLTRGVLTATATVPLQARFVGVDLLLLASTGLLIGNYITQRRNAKSLAQRLRERLKMSARPDRPGLASKTGRWLTQPSYSATYGQTGSSAMRRPGSGAGVARQLNRVTASNGFQLAATATRLGVGAASGGASVAVMSAVQTGRAAATVGRAAQTGHRVHNAIRHGAQRATTGHSRVDQALSHTARAHNYLEEQTTKAAAATKTAAVAATTQAVLAAGPRLRGPAPANNAYHMSRRTSQPSLAPGTPKPRVVSAAIRPPARPASSRPAHSDAASTPRPPTLKPAIDPLGSRRRNTPRHLPTMDPATTHVITISRPGAPGPDNPAPPTTRPGGTGGLRKPKR